jgi:acetyl esterase/lipase
MVVRRSKVDDDRGDQGEGTMRAFQVHHSLLAPVVVGMLAYGCQSTQQPGAHQDRAVGAPAHPAAAGVRGHQPTAPPARPEAAPPGHVVTGIGFRPPRSFWPGATPDSSAFNSAEGDQLGLILAHATLSDAVVTGDFDEDGNLDVAQTNVLAGSVAVLRGDGHGRLGEPRLLTVGTHPGALVVAQVDGDHHLDLVVTDGGSDDVRVLRGDGRGGFATGAVLPVPGPRSVAVGDVNGDRVTDLAVALNPVTCVRAVPTCDASRSTGGVLVARGTRDAGGQVSFAATQLLAVTRGGEPAGADAVRLVRLNGDQLDDLAVGVGTSSSAGDRPAGSTEPTGDDLVTYLARPDAALPYADAPTQRVRVGASPDDLATGDWNGDGRADLAALGGISGELTSLVNRGGGILAVTGRSVTVGSTPRGLAIADLDHDGLLDVATAGFAASTVSVLRGLNGGRFADAVDHWVGDAPTSVAAGDLDSDGRPDLVVARLRPDAVTVLRNATPAATDGIGITRDLSYLPAAGDPLAAHHTLDVYVPRPGTRPFTGGRSSYPVIVFAHGGGNVSGDKSTATFLMRRWAVAGFVAVSVNYRLGQGQMSDQTADVLAALQWVVRNVQRYGGDPAAVIASGQSAGGNFINTALTSSAGADLRSRLRGVVLIGAVPTAASIPPDYPPALLLNGSDGLERASLAVQAVYAAQLEAAGVEARHEDVADRDHLTLLSNLAREGDPGRALVLQFVRATALR